MLKHYKFEIILLIILAINFFLIYLVFDFRLGGDDFIEPARFVLGEEGAQPNRQFFIRPLGTLMTAGLAQFMDVYQAAILKNLVFYLLTPFLLFYAADYFFKNKRTAFYSAIFYATAFPYLKFSLNYMVDIVSWFFLVLSIFLTLKYLSLTRENNNQKTANLILYLNPIICFLGFLVKESGGIGIIFFVLAILLVSNLSFKQKIKKIFIISAIFLLFVFLFQVFITYKYDDNLIKASQWASQSYLEKSYSITNIFKKIIALFSIGWLYVAIGIYKIFKAKDKRKILILLALVPGSLLFLIWPYQAERLMYIIGPLLALLAAAGIALKQNGWHYRLAEICFLILFIIFNYSIDYLVRNYDLLYFL